MLLWSIHGRTDEKCIAMGVAAKIHLPSNRRSTQPYHDLQRQFNPDDKEESSLPTRRITGVTRDATKIIAARAMMDNNHLPRKPGDHAPPTIVLPRHPRANPTR
jgi:hypothetical protein